MNATKMMTAISNTLKAGEEIKINVTYARGRTLVHTYKVTADSIEHLGHSWGGRGTVRAIYAQRVLGR